METALSTAKKLLASFLEENSGVILRRVGITVSNFGGGAQKTLADY
jgi:hypothetical protein